MVMAPASYLPPSPADALAAVIAACKPGAKIVDLCDLGDNYMNELRVEIFPALHVAGALVQVQRLQLRCIDPFISNVQAREQGIQGQGH